MILNELQVRQVRHYLKANGVENRLTLCDFLDHICCMIEQQMEKGSSFEESLVIAFKKFPASEIKNIELFTLKILNMETSFSTRISLLATIPFGLFGLAWAFSNSGLTIPFIELFLSVVSVLAMFILLGVGWIKNFPRWSFPAIGFCLCFSLFFMMITIPAFQSEILGYWALLPLLITMTVSLMFNPTLKPVRQLAKKIKEDPALILFTFYGFAPFFVFLFYDEMNAVWLIPVILFSIIILSTGLYLFLRSEKKKTRIISIVTSGMATLIIAIIVSNLYWN